MKNEIQNTSTNQIDVANDIEELDDLSGLLAEYDDEDEDEELQALFILDNMESENDELLCSNNDLENSTINDAYAPWDSNSLAVRADSEYDFFLNEFVTQTEQKLTEPACYVKMSNAMNDLQKQEVGVRKFFEFARMAAICRIGKNKVFDKTLEIELVEIDFLVAMIGNTQIEEAIKTGHNVLSRILPYPQELIDYRHALFSAVSNINYEIKNGRDLSDWSHADQLCGAIRYDMLEASIILDACFEWNTVQHKLVIKDEINLGTLHAACNKDSEGDIAGRCISSLFLGLANTHDDFEQYKLKKSLKDGLSKSIINADSNIKSVIDACAVELPMMNVKSVITIVGEPESGKSTLANAAYEAANVLNNTQMNFLSIDCAYFTHENTISHFTGLEPFYRAPKQGYLTYNVEINPNTFIVFKNLNRAHPRVQRMVKDIIQNGFLTDTTTERRISFRNTQIVISITDNSRHNELQSNNDGANVLMDSQMGLDSSLTGILLSYPIIKMTRLRGIDSYELCKKKVDQYLKTFPFKFKASQYMDVLTVFSCGKNDTPSAIDNGLSELFEQIKEMTFDAIIDNNLSGKPMVDITIDLLPKELVLIGMDKQLAGNNEVHYTHISSKQFESNPNVLKGYKITVFGESASQYIKLVKTITLSKDSVILFAGDMEKLDNKEKQLVDASIQLPTVIQTDNFSRYALAQYAVKRQKLCKRRQLDVELKPALNVVPSLNKVNINYTAFNEYLSFDPEIYRHGFFKVIQPKERLDDVIGYTDVKKRISAILQQMNKFGSSSNPPPKGLIFEGPPGTGKTYLALAMAGESDLNVITANASDLISGNSIDNINTLVDAAESIAPAIVFIDEFDAIGRKRDGQSVGYSAIVNALLTRIDGANKPDAPVLFVAATNYAENLDPALLRAGRFDISINFTLPDFKERINAILKYTQLNQVRVNRQQAELLANLFEGKTYKWIENTINNVTNADDNNDHTVIDAVDVIRHIYPKPDASIVLSAAQEYILTLHAYRLAATAFINNYFNPNAKHIYTNLWHAEYFVVCEEISLHNYEDRSKEMIKLLVKRAVESVYLGKETKCTAFSKEESEQIKMVASVAIASISISEDIIQKELSNQQVSGSAESAFVRKVYKQTKKLVTDNWSIIEMIADKLMSNGEMFEHQFEGLFKEHTLAIKEILH